MRAPRHLNALRAFEAAARHLSFVSAAQELNVTPAAVGQLVKSIEESYGVSLFYRSKTGPSRLELTPPAITALTELQKAFDIMSAAVDGLRQGSTSVIVTVTVPPAFADKWLLKRVDEFQSKHSQIELILQTDGRLVDLAAEHIDIGIRFGHGHWSGVKATHLMDDVFFPVCSPSMLNGEFPLTSPEMLKNHVIIHDLSMPFAPAFPTWESWCDNAGVAYHPGVRTLRINDSAAVIQAAINGSGIALGRSSLVMDDLIAGRLVKPFNIEVSCPLAYYIVQPKGTSLNAAANTFKEWLECAVVNKD